jgi:hypothetical protein
MSRDIERILAKRQEDNLVAVWTEIQTAIKSYATEKQIDLVLAYGDPVEKELLDRFPNVKRKMESMDLGGTTPLHFAAHVDISNAVVKRIHDLRAKRK